MRVKEFNRLRKLIDNAHWVNICEKQIIISASVESNGVVGIIEVFPHGLKFQKELMEVDPQVVKAINNYMHLKLSDNEQRKQKEARKQFEVM